MGTDWITWRTSIAGEEKRREEGRETSVLQYSNYSREEAIKGF